MSYYYDDNGYEEQLHRESEQKKDAMRAMTPEELGKEWQRHCHRHDSAVDRCEEINSPTIEEAQRWMSWIEREFDRRGLRSYDYTITDEE